MKRQSVMAAGLSSCSFHFLLLLMMMFVCSVPVMTAPYLKTATGGAQEQLPLDHIFRPSQGLIGPLFRQNDYSLHPPSQGGCYYQYRHYDEGDRIITNEPCLNCTCHNSMLMCYLKVCPFTKPIGKDCTVEKAVDQCCPIITCPQVPVNLQIMNMSSTTTPSPYYPTAMAPYTEHGCTMDGHYYPDGAQVPGDPNKPCELCYCIRNHTACIMQECILKVEGCEPVFEDGICCPVRYKCSHDKQLEDMTTTTVAPNGTLITTTIQPPSAESLGCMHENEFYADGASIPSDEPCEHCYCMKSDVVCAIQECRSPLDEEDENCIPRAPPPGKCCPDAYDCPEVLEKSTILPEYTRTEIPAEDVTALEDATEQPAKEEQYPTQQEETESADAKPVDIEQPEDREPEKEPTESPESLPTGLETRTTGPDDTLSFTTKPMDDEVSETTTTGDIQTDSPTAVEEYQTEEPVKEDPDDAETKEEDKHTPDVLVDETTPTSTSEDEETASDVDETVPEEPKPITPEEEVTTDTETSSSTPQQTVEQEEYEYEEIPIDMDQIEMQFDPDDEAEETPATTFEVITESTPTAYVTHDETAPEEGQEQYYTTEAPKEGLVTEDPTDASVDETTQSEYEDLETTSKPEIDDVEEIPEAETTIAPEGEETDATSKPESAVEVSETLKPEDIEYTEEMQDDFDEDIAEFSTEAPTDAPVTEEVTTPQDSESGIATDKPEEMTIPEEETVVETVEETPQEETDEVSTDEEPVTTSEPPTDVMTSPPDSSIPSTEEPTESGATEAPETEEGTTPEVDTEEPLTTPSSVASLVSTCELNGVTYSNDEVVPISNVCQEECKCKAGVITCQRIACPSPPPVFLRCEPKTNETECCPSYDCPEPEGNEELSPNCLREGVQYMEGDFVPSEDLCTDCYCLYGDIICAYQECPTYEEGCIPLETPAGSCCPSKYECPELESDDMIKETSPAVEAIELTTESQPEDFGETDEDQTATDAPIPVDAEEEEKEIVEGEGKEETKTTPAPYVSPDAETDTDSEIYTETPVAPTMVLTEIQGPVTQSPETETQEEEETTPATLPEDPAATEEPVVTEAPVPQETKPEDVDMAPEDEGQIYYDPQDEYYTDDYDESPLGVTTPSDSLTVEDITTGAPQIPEEEETTKAPDQEEVDKEVEPVTDVPEEAAAATSVPDVTTESPVEEETKYPEETVATEDPEEVSGATELPFDDESGDYDETVTEEPIEPVSERPEEDEKKEEEEVDAAVTAQDYDELTTLAPETDLGEDYGTTFEVPDIDSQKPAEQFTVPEDQVTSEEKTTPVSPEDSSKITTPEPEYQDSTDEPGVEDATTGETSTQTPSPEVYTSYLAPDVTTETVETETSDATTSPVGETEEKGIPGEGSCLSRGTHYENGADVPVTSPCQKECTCMDSVVRCTLEACPAPPPVFLRCNTKQNVEECCPNYECPIIDTDPVPSPECVRNGTQYMEGDFIPSENLCTDCYCLYGEIVCATQECPPVAEGCTPLQTPPDSCCPTTYDCPDEEEGEKETAVGPEVETDLPTETEVPTTSQDISKEKEPEVTTVAETEDTETKTVSPDLSDPEIQDSQLIPSESPVTDETETSVDLQTDIPTDTETEDISMTESELPQEQTTYKPSDLETESPETYTTPQPEVESSQTEEPEVESLQTKEPVMTATEQPSEPSLTDRPDDLDASAVTESQTEAIYTSTESSDLETAEVDAEDDEKYPVDKTTSTPETTTYTLDEQEEVDETTPDTVEIVTHEQPEMEKEPVYTASPISTADLVTEDSVSEQPVDTQTETADETATEVTEEELTDSFTTKIPSTEDSETDTETPELSQIDLTDRPEDEADVTTPAYAEEDPDYTTIASPEMATEEGVAMVTESDPTVKPDQLTTVEYDKDLPESTTQKLDDYETTEMVEPSVEIQPDITEKEKTTSVPTEGEETATPSQELSTETQTDIPSGEETTPSEVLTEEEDTKTEPSEETTKVEGMLERCSWVDNNVYEHGDEVPSTDDCQEKCKCYNGSVKCERKACLPVPPAFFRCAQTFSNDSCCPEYDCAPEPSGKYCVKDGMIYNDGDYVPSGTICKDCYCLEGEVVCASLECGVPRENCEAIVQRDNECCPTLYECSEPVPTPEDFLATTEPMKVESVTQEESEPTVSEGDPPPADVLTPTLKPIDTEDVYDDEADDFTTEAVKEILTEKPSDVDLETLEQMKDPVESTATTKPSDTVDTDEDIEATTQAIDVTPTVVPDHVEESDVDAKEETTAPAPVQPQEADEDTEVTKKTVMPVSQETTTKAPLLPDTSSTDSTTISVESLVSDEPTVSMKPAPELVVSPEETIPETTQDDEVDEKEVMAESPFPPFPGTEQGQTYLPPHGTNETTTWKPTTTTELVLGPGSCLFDRRVYVSAEQIPRDDPCDFCFCFRGDIICLQQTCPDPIPGCYEEAIPGFCCPRYECPVRKGYINVTTTTPSPFPGFPPSYKTSRLASCEIEGKHYAVGEAVEAASSPCHKCICGSDGFMKCSPQDCHTARKMYKYKGYR